MGLSCGYTTCHGGGQGEDYVACAVFRNNSFGGRKRGWVSAQHLRAGEKRSHRIAKNSETWSDTDPPGQCLGSSVTFYGLRSLWPGCISCLSTLFTPPSVWIRSRDGCLLPGFVLRRLAPLRGLCGEHRKSDCKERARGRGAALSMWDRRSISLNTFNQYSSRRAQNRVTAWDSKCGYVYM